MISVLDESVVLICQFCVLGVASDDYGWSDHCSIGHSVGLRDLLVASLHFDLSLVSSKFDGGSQLLFVHAVLDEECAENAQDHYGKDDDSVLTEPECSS